MSWLYNIFGIGNPSTVTVDVPRRTDYPTREEAQWLRSIDATYGDPSAGYLQRESFPKRGGEPQGILSQVSLEDAKNEINNKKYALDPAQNRKPMDADTQDRLYQAWAASQRSPLLSLGFDPSRMVVTNSKTPTNIEGLYSRGMDRIWGNVGLDPSTLNHEAAHRSTEMMRKSGLEAPDLKSNVWSTRTPLDEGIIRAVMDRYFPGQETDEQAKEIASIVKVWPEQWKKRIDGYEDGALSLIMKNRRKMGPN